MKSISLIVLCAFLCSAVFATGGQKPAQREEKMSLEVTFEGMEKEFLVFVVKSDNVAAKSFFTIRNDEGGEIYRQLQTEASSLRRIRIPKAGLYRVYFMLGSRKQQITKTFVINTRIEETIQVEEVVR